MNLDKPPSVRGIDVNAENNRLHKTTSPRSPPFGRRSITQKPVLIGGDGSRGISVWKEVQPFPATIEAQIMMIRERFRTLLRGLHRQRNWPGYAALVVHAANGSTGRSARRVVQGQWRETIRVRGNGTNRSRYSSQADLEATRTDSDDAQISLRGTRDSLCEAILHPACGPFSDAALFSSTMAPLCLSRRYCARFLKWGGSPHGANCDLHRAR